MVIGEESGKAFAVAFEVKARDRLFPAKEEEKLPDVKTSGNR